MSEFVRFLLISNVSLILVWLGYWLFLRKTTFHSLNRGYLMLGSMISLLVPFIPIGSTTTQQIIGVQLPAVEVGSRWLPTVSSVAEVNWLWLAYAIGALIALGLFVRSVSSMIKLLNESDSEIINGQLVMRSDKSGPFSFLSIIHLPKKLPVSGLSTILRHEMAHVELGHSYDVLWLSFLRILFWFNPAMALYQRSLREIHEYQADALTHISFTKEHYVKVQLDQLFQLPSELSFANSFHNSNDLKKRIEMIYSEKTSKWGRMRYLLVVPLIGLIGLIASCTDTSVPPPPPPPPPPISSTNTTSKAPDSDANMVYKEVEVMPEFPGGMEEMMQYMIQSIKYPKELQESGVSGKVFVQFVIDTEGKVDQVEVLKGLHEQLDAEAVKVISGMPDWTPGKKDGKNVNVELVLPIAYTLE